MSIVNTEETTAWQWLQSGSGDSRTWALNSSGSSWDEYGDPAGFSFVLNGEPQNTVPEPGILSLFALGAMLMSGRSVFKRLGV